MPALLQFDDKDGVRVTLDSVTWEEHITGPDGHPEVRDCIDGIAEALRQPNVMVESGTSIVRALSKMRSCGWTLDESFQ